MTKVAVQLGLGWKVVTEYKADELAEGGDDKKTLDRVERAVERKEVQGSKARILEFPRAHVPFSTWWG